MALVFEKIAKNSNLVEIFQSPDGFQSPPAPSSGKVQKNRPIDQTTIDAPFLDPLRTYYSDGSTAVVALVFEKIAKNSNLVEIFQSPDGFQRPPAPSSGMVQKIVRSTKQPLITFLDPLRTYYCDGSTAVVALVFEKIAKNSNLVDIFQTPDGFQSPPAPSLRDGPKNRPIDQTTIDPRFSIHCERITLMVRPRVVALVFEKIAKTLISSKYFKVPTDFKVLRHRPPGWSKKSSIDQTTIDARFSIHANVLL